MNFNVSEERVQIAFWIVTGLLAAAFLMAGSQKIAKNKATIVASGMGWAEDYAPATIKLIGTSQVLAAIGLIVPPLVGIAPILSPIAAVCLAVLMLGAISVHVRRKESATPAIGLGVLAAASAVLGFLTVL